MSTMVQIRNVPDPLHRQLKARASLEGMTMSDYILKELSKVLEKPSREELFRRLRAQPVVVLSESPALSVRRERDGR
jgi:antitoxin FitA